MPELQANLHQLVIINIWALDQVLEALLSVKLQHLNILILLHGVASCFNEGKILHQDRGYGQTDLFAEIFKPSLVLGIDESLILTS